MKNAKTELKAARAALTRHLNRRANLSGMPCCYDPRWKAEQDAIAVELKARVARAAELAATEKEGAAA